MISKRAALFIAQGFGIGRIPFAPGTFGSLLGFVWFLALLATRNWAILITGILFGIILSAIVSEIAEEALGQTDPGSVVIDEIIAIPICFLGFICYHGLPDPAYFLRHWKVAALILIAFRVFDIWKPWPIRQSQILPGGWGVTVDDILAALCVAVLSRIFIAVID